MEGTQHSHPRGDGIQADLRVSLDNTCFRTILVNVY
jgi:hypothetical protein